MAVSQTSLTQLSKPPRLESERPAEASPVGQSRTASQASSVDTPKPQELTPLGQEAVELLAGQLAKRMRAGLQEILSNELHLRGMMESPDLGTRLAGYIAAQTPTRFTDQLVNVPIWFTGGLASESEGIGEVVYTQVPKSLARGGNTPGWDTRPTRTDDTFDPY